MGIKEILSGEQAFYNQPDYVEKTKADFAVKGTLPPVYEWNTVQYDRSLLGKIKRLARAIFNLLLFPFRFIHGLVGFAILPAAGFPSSWAWNERKGMVFSERDKWAYKRVTIRVDGIDIDAGITGLKSTLGNGRWTLYACGNAQLSESVLSDCQFGDYLKEMKSNAVVFNYPAVGASSGYLPNRWKLEKAFQAMLHFLEDQENGIGAKEIISYNLSLGGLVKGAGLQNHTLRDDISYVVITDKSGSNISDTVNSFTYGTLGWLVKLLGWNLDSVKASRQLKVPELVFQTGKDIDDAEEIQDGSRIVFDRIFHPSATLGKAILDDPQCPKDNKSVIATASGHWPSMHHALFGKKVSAYLKKNREELARKAFDRMSEEEKQHIYEKIGKQCWEDADVYQKMFGFLHLRADFFEGNRREYFRNEGKAYVDEVGIEPLANQLLGIAPAA